MASTSRRACRRPRQAYRMLRMAYRMLRYWIRRRSAISYVFGDASNDIGTLRTISYNTDVALHIVCDIVKNVRCRIRRRTYDWQEQVKNVLYRTFFGDIVRCTYDVVQKTYDIVYDIVYDIARTTGKNSILTYDVVRQTYDIVYDIVYDICMNRSCLGHIITHHCLNWPCSTSVSTRQQ